MSCQRRSNSPITYLFLRQWQQDETVGVNIDKTTVIGVTVTVSKIDEKLKEQLKVKNKPTTENLHDEIDNQNQLQKD